MKFEELSVKPEIIRALGEMEIVEPTEIQEKTIPLIKQGKDVVGISKTGSGKTAAFGIPIIEKVIPGQGLQVLAMAPTRELAVQISNVLKEVSKYLRMSITTVFGGVAIEPQMQKIAKADIVVGTPGRLLDHLERGTMDLSGIRCAVLDEADKMVEMGFIEDIEKILQCTPKQKQMLLFGATISDEIKGLKQKHMNDPALVKAETHVKEEFLKQYYYNIQPNEKFSLLVHLLKKEKTDRVMIFCSTRTTVEIVTKNIRAQGINAEMIHGKLNQNRRLRIMEGFNKGNPNVLVCSAVAARGLDIKDVSHIFNYDLSQDPQEYVHRVGRTARAGEMGKAITLLSPKDYDTFNEILDKNREMHVEELPVENFPKLRFDARGQFGNRGRFGGRGNFNGRRKFNGGHGRRFNGQRSNGRFNGNRNGYKRAYSA